MRKKSFVAISMMLMMIGLAACGKKDADKAINAEHPEVNVSVDMTDMSVQDDGVLPSGYRFDIPEGYRVDKVYGFDDHDHEATKDTNYYDKLLYGDNPEEATGKQRVTNPCIYKIINDAESKTIQVLDKLDPETFNDGYNDISKYTQLKSVTTVKGSAFTLHKLNDLIVATNGSDVYVVNAYGENFIDADEFEKILNDNF